MRFTPGQLVSPLSERSFRADLMGVGGSLVIQAADLLIVISVPADVFGRACLLHSTSGRLVVVYNDHNPLWREHA